jgi:hypothetical protein
LTLRVNAMNLEMVNRQVAEAENQAILAAWLHAESPRTTSGVTSISSTLGQRNKAAAAALAAAEAKEDADRAR